MTEYSTKQRYNRTLSSLFMILLLFCTPLGTATAARTLDLRNIDEFGYKIFGPPYVFGGSGGEYGNAVSGVGDINGDGMADYAIGAPNEFGTGIARVVFGTAGAVTIDLEQDVAPGFIAVSDRPGSRAGASVSSAGDFNGDGQPDLLVGSPGSAQVKGRLAIVFGQQAVADVFLDDLRANQGVEFVPQVNAGFRLGGAMSSVGDVNGDAFDDVAIAVPEDGRIDVVFGRRSEDTQIMIPPVQENGFGILSVPRPSAGSRELSVAGVGDMNGDGCPEIVVGSSSAPLIPPLGSGKVWIVLGQCQVPAQNISLRNVDHAVQFGESGRANFGAHVAPAGDFNGDGLQDALVASAAGLYAYVILGTADLRPQDLSFPGQGVIALQAPPGATVARVAGVGDLTGDGLGEVMIAYDDANNAGNGLVCVVRGRAIDGGSVSLQQDDTATCFRGADFREMAGFSIASAGDTDGNGFNDLLIGAPGFDRPTDSVPVVDAGRVYAILLSGLMPREATYTTSVVPVVGGQSPCPVANPYHAVGSLGNRQDMSSPASRLWISLCRDAAGPVPLAASRVSVKVFRMKPAPRQLPVENAARIHWRLSWPGGAPAQAGLSRVALRYTDAEVAGLDETTLRIFASADQSPMYAAAASSVDVDRNIVYATVTTDHTLFLALRGEPAIVGSDYAVEVAATPEAAPGQPVSASWTFRHAAGDAAGSIDVEGGLDNPLILHQWTCTSEPVDLCPNVAGKSDHSFEYTLTLGPTESVTLQMVGPVDAAHDRRVVTGRVLTDDAVDENNFASKNVELRFETPLIFSSGFER